MIKRMLKYIMVHCTTENLYLKFSNKFNYIIIIKCCSDFRPLPGVGPNDTC